MSVPVALPSGTVTFLFTDIENSSPLWEEQPAAMSVALARHDELLRTAVADRAGVVFSKAGDGLAAVFARAGDAIKAAAAAQCVLASERWPVVLKVRMGVHTGEAEERDGDYFGPALNRAARLMSSATGGQVLVSLATAELVRDRLPVGLSLVELGPRTLRSLTRPEQVFELTWSELRPAASIHVRILGPLRLSVGSVDVDVPGPKRRAVLALLAMSFPSPVPTDTLISALSPDDAARSDRAALHSHITRLRRHLATAAERLESVGGGYRLRLGTGELDATQATELFDGARRAAATEPTVALELVRDARRLWRGEPLAEFAEVEALAAWGRSLEEMRLAAADLHVGLALTVGDLPDAVGVALATVTEQPLREPSVLLLMRALAKSGRAVEALRAGHTYRRLLVDQAGLAPSPALGALEHEIAVGLAAVEPVPSAVAPTPDLPAARTPLLGRDAELAGIARLTESECLVTLVGPGGVGKTMLAFEVARRDRGRARRRGGQPGRPHRSSRTP